MPIAPCSSLRVEHSLDPGATGVCKHWACRTPPLKPPASQNPWPQFLFSWGSFCKALQAPLLLLCSGRRKPRWKETLHRSSNIPKGAWREGSDSTQGLL
ncbi:unnamed protein product [Gulo gulo]|uniref:Uncharacterized protein n=1 Tax=Gulo gulo TaxID=48420 RepID=A0A9X9PWQ9_GULGU|nr:unnamed protein product [Gulo gulo]